MCMPLKVSYSTLHKKMQQNVSLGWKWKIVSSYLGGGCLFNLENGQPFKKLSNGL